MENGAAQQAEQTAAWADINSWFAERGSRPGCSLSPTGMTTAPDPADSSRRGQPSPARRSDVSRTASLAITGFSAKPAGLPGPRHLPGHELTTPAACSSAANPATTASSFAAELLARLVFKLSSLRSAVAAHGLRR